jgi:hypothetical protein
MLNELIYRAAPWLLTLPVLADAKGSACDPVFKPTPSPFNHPTAAALPLKPISKTGACEKHSAKLISHYPLAS